MYVKLRKRHLFYCEYLGSVLHYSAYAFAVDPTIPTIIVPDGVEIGQRVGFSEVRLINLDIK